MSLEAVLFQALNGLATASSLFLVGAGLSLIFGVTRIINIAHGSFYMVGLYLAYTFATSVGGALGFWGGIVGAALIVGALGAATEIALLRRVYQAPELFQLLATFALVLVINDVTQYLWGPEDLLGPRAPGLRGSIAILGRRFPSYDLFLIGIGPLVLLLLYLMVARTRFGRLIRAATQDREMVGALGVNQAMLFTVVFALGSLLAGLGGALQVAREPANLGLDLTVIGDAFVVVVVGGMGSIGGAFLAALIIAEVKALCIGIGVVNVGAFTMNFSKLTLVAEFLVMAIVLIVRPYGLLGRPQGAVRNPAEIEDPIRPANLPVKLVGGATLLGLLILPLAAALSPYTVVLAIDILIAILFATSLHFIMGPGGMASFGHAAYFGLGAYGAGLVVKFLTGSMAAALLGGLVAAAAGALLFGWFAVRLSGVYLAMLTLAFAQIVWSILYQWEGVTGGSNGILGIWPRPPFDSRSAFLSADTCLRGRRSAVAAPVPVCSVRLRDARGAGLAAEGGGDRHRRQARALDRLCHRGNVRRRGRSAVCVRQRHHLARSRLGLALARRHGHGAARRHPDVERPDRGRSYLYVAAGHDHAPDAFLARAPWPRNPSPGAGISQRHRGRAHQPVCAQRQARMSILCVRNLSKAFGGVHAINNVSFDIAEGEFLALIGPNGAGKSTCFNIINGQLTPDRGEVRFSDRSLVGLRPREIWRLGVGRTFQVAATFGSMTAAENIQLALASHHGETYRFGKALRHRCHSEALALLARVGMADAAGRACKELAYGDVKRVELAVALANDPRLLLMDEPTAGMAPRERDDLIALVKRLVVEKKISVLFTEHSMDVVFAYADRILVLAGGALIAEGNAAAIRDNRKVQQVYLGTGLRRAARGGARP